MEPRMDANALEWTPMFSRKPTGEDRRRVGPPRKVRMPVRTCGASTQSGEFLNGHPGGADEGPKSAGREFAMLGD